MKTKTSLQPTLETLPRLGRLRLRRTVSGATLSFFIVQAISGADSQYSTNLATTNWFGLAVLTNSFRNGINETICGRPPGDRIFLRIRSQSR